MKKDYLKWMEEDLQQRIELKEKEVVRILEELNDQFAFILNENDGKFFPPAGIADDASTLARFASELVAFDAVRRDLARLHKRPQTTPRRPLQKKQNPNLLAIRALRDSGAEAGT